MMIRLCQDGRAYVWKGAWQQYRVSRHLCSGHVIICCSPLNNIVLVDFPPILLLELGMAAFIPPKIKVVHAANEIEVVGVEKVITNYDKRVNEVRANFILVDVLGVYAMMVHFREMQGLRAERCLATIQSHPSFSLCYHVSASLEQQGPVDLASYVLLELGVAAPNLDGDSVIAAENAEYVLGAPVLVESVENTHILIEPVENRNYNETVELYLATSVLCTVSD
ncbi:hypothetical protein TorRG33x02_135010 [Trema orientale]|uniref:Uncharacterized protein n=1 Tax=Trema orientale TaxID=63057 RepID=A0A2P5EYN4_TREOI|nr:hypothetical protein TorRG33x02_135010 [Trema orientale]